MAANVGVPLTNLSDGYVTEGIDIKGGYFVINSLSNISPRIVEKGSLCYVISETKWYYYNANIVQSDYSDYDINKWVEVGIGGSYLPLAGGTLTGGLTMAGSDIILGTESTSSNDSGDIRFNYGNGKEKARIWTDNTYSTALGPNYRCYDESGNNVYSGRLAIISDIPSGNALWNNGDTNWAGDKNVVCSGGGTEWSFDVTDTSGNESAYWHVWSGNLSSSMLQCYPSSGRVNVSHRLTVGGNDVITNAGTNPQSSDPNYPITHPGGANVKSIRTDVTSGRDVGIFYMSDDNAYICNSSDDGYTFAVWDTDLTQDFRGNNLDAASFSVLSNGGGIKTRGTIYEGNTALSDKYLQLSDVWQSLKSINTSNTSTSPNTIWSRGIYQMNQASGLPADWGTLLVGGTQDEKTGGGTWNWQLFHSTNGRWYTRQAVNQGDWDTDWKTIAYTSDIVSADQSTLTSTLGLGTLNNDPGWGTVKASNGYTIRWGADQASGGGFAIGEKAVSQGNYQTSIQIDGQIYVNEGSRRVAANGDDSLNINGQITATNFRASSDKRLKENIEPFNYDKSILDLPIYKYDFKNGEKNQIGCMAQDLQNICPELVSTNENGYLNISESKIVYLLLEEIKKLNTKVNELESKINKQ